VSARIVALGADHLDAVVAIERVVSPTPWTARLFGDVIASPDGAGFVALGDADGSGLPGEGGAPPGGEVEGFALVLLQAGDAHVMNVAVRPERRRTGLASALVLALVDEARARRATALTLEVRASNIGAQRLYHRFGFAPVGVRPRYYQGEDAVIMWTPPADDPAWLERIETVRAQIMSSGRVA